MYRFRTPELFLGCLLTVAVFSLGMLFDGGQWQQSRPAEQQIPKQTTSENRPKTETPDAELTGSTWLTKDAAGFFAFIAAIILIGQAILFAIQLRYMRDGMNDAAIAANAARDGAFAAIEANKISRESAIADRRPWLAIEDFTFSEALAFTDGGAVASFNFKIKNFGKSPAMKASTYVHIYANGSQRDIRSEETAFLREVLFRKDTILGETVFPDSFVLQAVSSSILQSEIDSAIVTLPYGRQVSISIWAGVSYETDTGTEYYTLTQFWMRGRLLDEPTERSDSALCQMSTRAV